MNRANKPFPAQYWLAPGCLVLGTANLCRAAYFYFLHDTLTISLAAGAGLLVIGLMATYYAWDDYQDRWLTLNADREEEELSAEEYARRFDDR